MGARRDPAGSSGSLNYVAWRQGCWDGVSPPWAGFLTGLGGHSAPTRLLEKRLDRERAVFFVLPPCQKIGA